MSLENEIQRLTAAIEKLNANLEAVLATPLPAPTAEPVQAVETATEKKSQPEPVKTGESKPVDFAEVQSRCLALSRQGKKDAIRALLDDFGASKVSDLGDKLATFADKLEQL